MKFKRLFIYILTLTLIMIGTTTFADTGASDLSIYSESAILIDSNTGVTLYEKNADQKMYPASTTKILTAILAIENSNLDDITTVNKSAISNIPYGYSSAYLTEGEKIAIKYVLQVFLVHSANEAGNVLAEHVSGSIETFVDLMNKKVQEIGCTNTHFVNTNGIHNEDHYTTAKDLSIIARYCMKNQTFRDIVSMKSCNIPKTNKFDIRIFKNTNDLINTSSKYYIKDCIGVKTGFTSEAKNCLVSAFNKDGLELISVVLGAPQIKNGESTRYIDSTALYKYGYSNYEIKKIAAKGDIISNIDVVKGNKDTKNLDLILANDILAIINKNNLDVKYKVDINENLTAPISANSVVGTVTYKVEDVEYTENLLASHDVIKIDYSFIIFGISIVILILILLLILKLILNKTKKRK